MFIPIFKCTGIVSHFVLFVLIISGSVFHLNLLFSLYCPDLELDNTKLQVFVYDSKIVGIKLVTYNPNIAKNQIYKYAKNKYGNLDDEVTREGWTGYRILKSGNDSILYAKHETMHGIYEELDISTEELVDYTMGEEGVIEDNI